MFVYFWFLCSLILFTINIFNFIPKRKRTKRSPSKDEPYALNIIINTDLNMKHGKIVSQACHAVSGVIEQMNSAKSCDLGIWRSSGEAKIVLKAKEEQILEVLKNSQKKNIPVYRVYDAGKTQVPAGSNTVIAVGPAPKALLTLITGHLKLY